MFNMHGLLYLSTLQCLRLIFPHGKGKKYDFQLCRPRFHFHALILHVHVEDTLIHCYPSCWDSKHLLNTHHPRGNLTADPVCVMAVSYPLSYTGRNLKQRGFTFCRCSHQLGWLITSDKVTTVLSRDAELSLCSLGNILLFSKVHQIHKNAESLILLMRYNCPKIDNKIHMPAFSTAFNHRRLSSSGEGFAQLSYRSSCRSVISIGFLISLQESSV